MGTKSYLIGQGYSNLKKHTSKTFSTMFIICATMIILGLYVIAFINIKANVKVVAEQQGMQAFISDNIEENEIKNIANKINHIGNIKEIKYLDKDDALKDAKDTLEGYEYLLDGLETSNPFPRSFIITFSSLDNTQKVKEAVETVEGIYKVSYNADIINAVLTISNIGKFVIFGIGTAMIIISIFIISNTIKLAVYSNKREIYIMKYIGATSQFIKAPFITEGLIMGIGSALFSWVLISLGYIAAYSRLPIVGSTLGVFGFVAYSSFWYIVLATFIILGILLGGVGSNIATKRYLKEFKPDKLPVKNTSKKNQTTSSTNVETSERKVEAIERRKRRNKSFKHFIFILLVMLSLSISYYQIEAATTQENIEEIKKQQSATAKKYDQTSSDISIYEKQIGTLNKEITKYKKEVDNLNIKVSTISSELEILEKELQNVSVGYQATQDVFNTRIRVLYENGFVNVWQMLFTSSNVLDFLSKYNVVITLLNYDQKMLKAMQGQKEYIDNLKKDAELRKLQIEQVEYDVSKSKQALETAKENKQAKLTKLEGSQKELKTLQATLKKQLNDMIKKLEAELAAAKNSYKGVFIGFSWPVEGSSKLTTYFNEMYNPFGTGARRHYWGIDLARSSSYTTHIYSIAAGKVTKVGYDQYGWGRYVIVSHGTNENDGATYVSQYSHLKSVSVTANQIIGKGQTVGIMGTTGASTGYHLDLILKRNNVYVDPLKYIPHKLSNGWYSAM